MSVENIPQIGNQLGQIINFKDCILNEVLLRSFLHVKVLLTLSQPLKLEFLLSKSSEEHSWIKVKYERL